MTKNVTIIQNVKADLMGTSFVDHLLCFLIKRFR